MDFMGYRNKKLPAEKFCIHLKEMGTMGVKSIMYGGEGEPLLHPQLEEIVTTTTASGIDSALTTNGVLMTPKRSRKLLEHCTWIKVSLNAGTPDTYAAIHNCRQEDFFTVFSNLEAAATCRLKKGLTCTIGAQVLLLPENAGEIRKLAVLVRDSGADYLVVKPYSQHPKSRTRNYSQITYEKYLHLTKDLKTFNQDGFSVIFREKSMRKWDTKQRSYSSCFALPFWAYIDSNGNIWGCSSFLGEEEFRYGNIFKENSFKKVWTSKKAKLLRKKMESDGAARNCRYNCRMDEVNRFLQELSRPPEHANFI